MSANLLRTQAVNLPAGPYPDIDATAPVDDILWMFFKYDVVCIRNMLPVSQVRQFYNTYVAPIYRLDDETIASDYRGVTEWEKPQIENGWIGEDRLGWFSGGKATLEDPLHCHLYTRLADRLMGATNWQQLSHLDCHTYRLSQKARLYQLGYSVMSTELDALWLNDKQFMLNFWTPLTEGDNNFTHIELILATPDEIKQHGCYDPSIPDEPKGSHNTNSRLAMERFHDKTLKKAFGPNRRWSPELKTGDVIVSSNWAAHTMCFPADTKNDRIFLEYVVFGNRPDSPLRKIYSN